MGLRSGVVGIAVVAVFAGMAGVAHAQDHLYDKCLFIPTVYIDGKPMAQSTVCIPWPIELS